MKTIEITLISHEEFLRREIRNDTSYFGNQYFRDSTGTLHSIKDIVPCRVCGKMIPTHNPNQRAYCDVHAGMSSYFRAKEEKQKSIWKSLC
jgi:hypothetical protein